MILAGDIGGTNTRLAFFEATGKSLRLISESVYPSREHAGLEEIASLFVRKQNRKPSAACFGIAGPVLNGRVQTSNLPWVIEAASMARALGLPKTLLINDLEANGWGIAALKPEDLVSVYSPKNTVPGNQAVISAGTGLGEAGLFWDGAQHHVFACEGGHTDFGPRTPLEMELLQYLTARFGHVSYERILSGPGLVTLFEFFRDTGRGNPPVWLLKEISESDPGAAISHAAMEKTCNVAMQALDVFVSIYGAEAGNVALKFMSTGGLYVGGGIAPKILSKLQSPLFLDAFLDKGRMRKLLEHFPVFVINNDKTALLGAARCALVNQVGE